MKFFQVSKLYFSENFRKELRHIRLHCSGAVVIILTPSQWFFFDPFRKLIIPLADSRFSNALCILSDRESALRRYQLILLYLAWSSKFIETAFQFVCISGTKALNFQWNAFQKPCHQAANSEVIISWSTVGLSSKINAKLILWWFINFQMNQESIHLFSANYFASK